MTQAALKKLAELCYAAPGYIAEAVNWQLDNAGQKMLGFLQ